MTELTLTVNGEARQSRAATLLDLLAEEGLDPSRRGIAVAMDGAVVRRAQWGQTALRAGCVVEIVKPAAGG